MTTGIVGGTAIRPRNFNFQGTLIYSLLVQVISSLHIRLLAQAR